MALNGTELGTAIKTAIEGLTPAEKSNLELAWQTIATEITDHIAAEGGEAPIGSIMPWYKHLTGTPGLPINWAELNGQTISDPDSPYDGVTLPNINGQERFIRGGNTSGTLQADAFQGHRHKFTRTIATVGQSGTDRVIFNSGTDSSGQVLDPETDGVNGAPRIADETRPKNISMVFIIRIK